MTKEKIDELVRRLDGMADRDVARLYNQQEPGSEEADVIAAVMERRGIDD